MATTYTHPNGNGSSLNGRGIRRRALSHRALVNLAADAVSGEKPVRPSLKQVPAIFEGVSSSEVSAELDRRKAAHLNDEADAALFAFAAAWEEHSPEWRAQALRWVSTVGTLGNFADIESALALARK